MKKIITLIAATVAISAQAGPYVDMGVTALAANSNTVVGSRLIAGYDFGAYSIEGMVLSPGMFSGVDTPSHSISPIMGIYAKKDIGSFYGRVGVTQSSATNNQVTGYIDHPKTDTSAAYRETIYGKGTELKGPSLSYGVGYTHTVSQKMSLSLDYMMYSAKIKESGISYSVKMAF